MYVIFNALIVHLVLSTPWSFAGVPEKCIGLPKEKDHPPFLDLAVTAYQDSLLHAKCGTHLNAPIGEGDCKPIQLDVLEKTDSQLKGGFITSTARSGASTLKDALAMDQRVSNFVTRTKGNFWGLCDVSITSHNLKIDESSPYFEEEIQKCIQLPGMIGVGELQFNPRFSAPAGGGAPFQLLSHGKMTEKFEAILRLLQENDGGGTISIHFNNLIVKNQRKLFAPHTHETSELLQFAKKYPKVSFIILHSGLRQMVDLNGISEIGEFYKAHPNLPKNIWTDVSAATDPNEWEATGACDIKRIQAKLAQAWRTFGIDRVIYGSDGEFQDNKGPDRLMRYRQALVENPYLSPSEKKKILFDNFNSLIKIHKKERISNETKSVDSPSNK